MNGKGDTPRPLSVDRETFESNWDKIFAKNSTDDACAYSGLLNTSSYNEIQKNVDELTEKVNYMAELKSGMFWEWYPTLTGNWEEDKTEWKTLKTINNLGE